MKYIIKDNKIFAIHENNQNVEGLYPDCTNMLSDTIYNIGDSYNLTEEEIQQALIAEQNKKTITKRQLLFWLFIKKSIKEDSILTAIESIQDETNRYLAKTSYTGTNNFEYGNPFVSVIGTALGLTEQELIQCFDEAKLM